ncbi:MAG: hypothetical protein AAFY71_25205 [Bacteroidota bacterium]
MKKLLFLLSALALIWTLSSCETTETYNAPPIPPLEMATIPAEALEEMDPDTASTQRATYYNWLHAGVNLVVWNAAIYLNTAIPVAAFHTAVNQPVTYLGNGKFEWSYVYQAPAGLGGKTYDIVLTAEYINTNADVEWVMTSSERGGFQNFIWYTGISSVNENEASFTVNRNPGNPIPVYRIDYDRISGTSDFSIRFTDVNPNSNGIDGYLEYRVDSQNLDFNRAFDIKGGPNKPDLDTEIQWDEPNGNGRVKDSKRFGNNDWQCWDTNQADVVC